MKHFFKRILNSIVEWAIRIYEKYIKPAFMKAIKWLKGAWMHIVNLVILFVAYGNLDDKHSAESLVGFWIFILLGYYIFIKLLKFTFKKNIEIEKTEEIQKPNTPTPEYKPILTTNKNELITPTKIRKPRKTKE